MIAVLHWLRVCMHRDIELMNWRYRFFIYTHSLLLFFSSSIITMNKRANTYFIFLLFFSSLSTVSLLLYLFIIITNYYFLYHKASSSQYVEHILRQFTECINQSMIEARQKVLYTQKPTTHHSETEYEYIL